MHKWRRETFGRRGGEAPGRPGTRPKRGTLYCKVSPKGGMSLYGLQRMPVTLYVEQWQRLLAFADDIQAFLKEHDAELKRKALTPTKETVGGDSSRRWNCDFRGIRRQESPSTMAHNL